ncbi:MAG: SufD family Fe-S cluster assembly protein, partial [Elusimicrobia bacterium]|nr:SufD family Fe-S cluster assembly protein [Elusimicrobiota bacterium]
MTATLNPTDRFAELFAGEKGRLPGHGLSWLASAREAAFAAFESEGLPHARFEGWRHTSATTLTATEFFPAERPAVRGGFGGRALCPITFHRVVIHNGRVQPNGEGSLYTSLPSGVKVSGLADVLRDDPESLKTALSGSRASSGTPFASLAASLFADGVVVRVAKHVRLDKPLQLLFVSDDAPSGRPQAAHVRVLVALEEGASAEVVVESVGGGRHPFWTNLLTHVELGEGASLKHYRLQRENEQGTQTAATFVNVGRSARYESHAFNFGGALVRHDLRVRLAGEGADCVLNGLSLVRGSEIVDHHTVVEHAAVGGTTRELYKAVLDERGRFIFDGLVDVRPGAQKTDASV